MGRMVQVLGGARGGHGAERSLENELVIHLEQGNQQEKKNASPVAPLHNTGLTRKLLQRENEPHGRRPLSERTEEKREVKRAAQHQARQAQGQSAKGRAEVYRERRSE